MNHATSRAQAIFLAAAEIAVPQERTAFLDRECGDDLALRARVEALLASHHEAGDFLETTSLSPEIEVELARLKPEEGGEMIGPYKLREQIGEGGFGTVWVADQEKPVRRRVALKIIKMGMDTREVIARFEQERQALAMMDHPNIAKVLDAGATQYGRPFFVMELVRGIKITDYCDQQELPTAERLALFIRVCNAVQHAHQKGIIHRDLKPSNILVTINDGEAVPKVIDFGVAKATQGRLTDHTVYTQFQQMIGTPLYMSPEQAEMTSLDIDTRSDIYSLGVLLYELLTGHTPIEQETLARVGMDEIRRVIREVDPPRPSIRVGTMEAAELTTTAKRRHMDPAKLTSALRGDLDWIVMKALEKNRNRRYETANGLAMDLQRHMQSEPVLARPPSFGYKAGKFIRKNRGPVAAAAAVLLALIAGLVASTLLYFDKKAAWASESAQRAKVEIEATKSQQVAKFLQDMLKGVGPQVALGQDTKLLRKILDETATRVSNELKGQPAVEVELRETLGTVYFDLDELKGSEAMFREALLLNVAAGGTRRDKVAARLLNRLGHTLTATGNFNEAKRIYEEALSANTDLGPVSEGVAKSLYGLGEAALTIGSPQTSDPEAAERYMLKSLDQWKQLRMEQSKEAVLTQNDLGLVLLQLGKPADAEKALTESFRMRKQTSGGQGRDFAEALGNLGLAEWYLGRLADAESNHRKALAIYKDIQMPENHQELAAVHNNLSLVLRDKGELEEAESVQQTLLASLKPDDKNKRFARNNLAILLRRRGAQSGDLDKLLESLQINPADTLTADAMAALLASPILSEKQSSAAAWQYTRAQPGSKWKESDFSETGWDSTPPPHGGPTFFPRKPNTPITSHTDIWLRREFNVTDPPPGKLLFRVNRNQDAEIFLNGVRAAPIVDWSDTDTLVPCTEPLQRGPNVLAVHCLDADGNAPIDVKLFASSDPTAGRKELIEEFKKLINREPQRADLYAGRASVYARLGQWSEAATDLGEAIKLKGPSEQVYYWQLALILHRTGQEGDQQAYPKHRKEALDRFANEDRPDNAAKLSQLALLDQVKDSELAAALKLAEIGAPARNPAGLAARQFTKGLARYRAGDFTGAIDWMKTTLETNAQKNLPGWNHERERNRKAAAYLVTAMAQYRGDDTKTARQTLTDVIKFMDTEFPKVDSGDLGREWADWLFADILRREAEALIGNK